MMKSIITLIFTSLIHCMALCAQTAPAAGGSGTMDTLKGRVVDSLGMGLDGASVALKGSAIRTSTDREGHFSLRGVPRGAELEVSHIGYHAQTVRVDTRGITVVLAPTANRLEEVLVSTGYQTLPKERATGSFEQVDNRMLNMQVGTDLMKRLEGMVAGLTFNRNGYPEVRGMSTINGPAEVLVVVDGFAYDGGVNNLNVANLNPNDIQDVTILKDAAAASIWGARAGNGVIVITTKKGRFNQPARIEANATLLVQEKPDLWAIPRISPSDFIDVEEFLFNNNAFSGDILLSERNRTPLSPAVQVFRERAAGLISPADSASRIDALKGHDSRSDYLAHFYRPAVTQQYAFSIRGGGSSVAYLFSAAYDKGITDLRARNDRLNLHLANTFNPVKGLDIRIGAYYTGRTGRNGMNGDNGVRVNGKQIPYLRLVGENGKAIAVESNLSHGYIDTAGGGRLLDWRHYPLTDWTHRNAGTSVNSLIGNIGMDYRLWRGLSASVSYQYQQQLSALDRHETVDSWETRNRINLFTQIDPQTGELRRMLPVGGIRTLSETRNRSYGARGQLNYQATWGGHAVSALVGTEINERLAEGRGYPTVYGYSEDPLYATEVDISSRYPTFITGSMDYISTSRTAVFTNATNRFASFYGNMSHTFRDRYILSASARKDGSNIFGLRANEKWNPLWSAGLAWVLDREAFYRVDWLPKLKLRATYGHSGNIDPNRRAVPEIGYYSPSTAVGTSIFPFASVSGVANSDLRWEKTSMLNVGADFSSKDNAISGTIEYYVKKGSDLYGPTNFDYTVYGVTNQIVKNVANMMGQGLDLTLRTRNTGGAVKWQTDLIFNYVVNRTTAYHIATADRLASLIGSGTAITPVIGKPLHSIASYRWGGLDERGNPQGYLGGELSTNYRGIFNEVSVSNIDSNVVYHGSSKPTYLGTLGNSLTWRGVTLNVYLAYDMGYYFRRSSLSYSQLQSQGDGHREFADRWREPGDEHRTDVPAMVFPFDSNRDRFYAGSETNVARADNIRIRFVSASYTLPSPGTGWPSVNVSVNASNLGFVWRADSDNIDLSVPTYALGLRITY